MTGKPLYIKVGDRVWLTPVDPWELVTETGSGPFGGTVVAVEEKNHESIAFRLDCPLTYGSVSAELFSAFTRHGGSEFTAHGPRETTFCYVDSITEGEVAHFVGGPRLHRGELSMLGDVAWASSGSS